MNNQHANQIPQEILDSLNADAERAMQGEFPPIEREFVPSIKMLRNIDRQIRRRRNLRFALLCLAIVLPLLTFCGVLMADLYGWGKQVAYRTVEVPVGERLKMMLPDGSKVTLNAGSILEYPASFKRNKREIYLVKGEVYCEIAENRKAPFTLRLTDADITVLGTKFNVERHLDNNISKVYLSEGSIRLTENLSGKKSSHLLKPQEMLTINRSTGQCQIIRNVNPKSVEGWVNGHYHFRAAPLSEMVKYIERNYAVTLRIADSDLYKYTYTLTIHNESIDEVLNILETVTPVRFVRIGNEITMHARN